jgi:transposase
MQALKQTHQYPYVRENLRSLDPELVIDMLLSLDAKYTQLGDYVRNLVTEKYASKSERFEGPGQLLIFPGGETAALTGNEADTNDIESQSKNKAPSKSKKPGHSRNPQPPELPRVSIFAPTPDMANLLCPCCGLARVQVRQILQNTRYQFVPASLYLEDLYCSIYECLACDLSEKLVAKVAEPVKNGLAAPGLLAQVAISRDFDHIPFNRQSNIYRRSGVNLHRSTLSDFYSHVASILLVLYEHMHQILLQSKIISTDDTPVKVLDRTKAKNIKLARQWIYLGDKEHPVNLLDYTVTRGRDGPLTFLRGFIGFLQGDCFSGNLAVCAAIGTTLVACLAHARRYFVKALLNDKSACNQALSSFGKALFYCLNNWNELTIIIPSEK